MRVTAQPGVFKTLWETPSGTLTLTLYDPLAQLEALGQRPVSLRYRYLVLFGWWLEILLWDFGSVTLSPLLSRATPNRPSLSHRPAETRFFGKIPLLISRKSLFVKLNLLLVRPRYP